MSIDTTTPGTNPNATSRGAITTTGARSTGTGLGESKRSIKSTHAFAHTRLNAEPAMNLKQTWHEADGIYIWRVGMDIVRGSCLATFNFDDTLRRGSERRRSCSSWSLDDLTETDL